MNDMHPDIMYRVFCKTPREQWEWDGTGAKRIVTNWYMNFTPSSGPRGCYSSVKSARTSASRAREIGGYEIWKFHIGLPDSEIPWFPPEKVFEK